MVTATGPNWSDVRAGGSSCLRDVSLIVRTQDPAVRNLILQILNRQVKYWQYDENSDIDVLDIIADFYGVPKVSQRPLYEMMVRVVKGQNNVADLLDAIERAGPK